MQKLYWFVIFYSSVCHIIASYSISYVSNNVAYMLFTFAEKGLMRYHFN